MTLMLRAARHEDAGDIGEILWRFQEDNDWMPKLHLQAESHGFCAQLIARGWVTVALAQGRPVGFLARDGEEICALYLASTAWRRGIGTVLMNVAKSARDQLWLSCFQANRPARAFYTAQGFRETARSDGQGNDEKLPDLKFVWERDVTT